MALSGLLALVLFLGCGASPGPVAEVPRPPPDGSRAEAPGQIPGQVSGQAEAPAAPVEVVEGPISETPPAEYEAPRRLSCLTAAYPDAIRSVEARGGAWFVTFRDGREVPWDDGRDKGADERLTDPDLEDTVAQLYPAGRPTDPVAEGDEPGRARHPVLFANAYGDGERAVRAHLVDVPWPSSAPASVRFSSENGAADALRAVIASLSELPPGARQCLEPPIGSFSYRQIRGTERLSGHAYGIAIDLNISCGEYWRWQRPFRGREQNRMPEAIVRAFEAHGFIWGGRWHHYDTFHFEYRPEFFAPACRTEAR